jgi:hypothetical protein
MYQIVQRTHTRVRKRAHKRRNSTGHADLIVIGIQQRWNQPAELRPHTTKRKRTQIPKVTCDNREALPRPLWRATRCTPTTPAPKP